MMIEVQCGKEKIPIKISKGVKNAPLLTVKPQRHTHILHRVGAISRQNSGRRDRIVSRKTVWETTRRASKPCLFANSPQRADQTRFHWLLSTTNRPHTHKGARRRGGQEMGAGSILHKKDGGKKKKEKKKEEGLFIL